MATRQEDIARTTVGGTGFDARKALRAGFSRTFTWLDAVLLGGATPRHYRREGYPEIEIAQIIAGRKDRFDSR
jgi:hypothetical protein